MIHFFSYIILYITMFISFLIPGNPNEVKINVYDNIADGTSIKFSYVNETKKFILNRCKIESVERCINNEWVKCDFSQINTDEAFYHNPGNTEYGELRIENLEPGEYRMTISYDVVDGIEKYITGYSTAIFTVIEAE